MSRSCFIHRRGGANYPNAVLADGPILYWRFDEHSGTSAADSSGHGHTGTIHPGTGTISLAQPSPINSDAVSTSYTFAPGSSGFTYVLAAASTDWGVGHVTNLTFEAWVHPTSGQTNKQGVMSIMDDVSGSAATMYVRIGPSDGSVEIYEDLNTFISGSNRITFNAWNYLVVTFTASDSKYRIYVNGHLTDTSGTSTLGGLSNSYPFTAGHNNSSQLGSETFVGGMDEVAVYLSALSATRIADHYNEAF